MNLVNKKNCITSNLTKQDLCRQSRYLLNINKKCKNVNIKSSKVISLNVIMH